MIAEKTYLKPKRAVEAITYAQDHSANFRYVAGGTDVLVNKFQGNDESECLIDISGIDGLRDMSHNEQYLQIGALVTLEDLQKNNLILQHFPALIEAAHSVGTPLIRKSATIGGNILCENRCVYYNQTEWWRESVGYCLKCEGDICIATDGTKGCFSKFVSDTAPVLIACNAQIEIEDVNGSLVIPLENIYTGDGIHPRNLSKTAIVKSIRLPFKEKYHCIFKKLRVREAVDYTSLTTAVSSDENGNARIVIGGVDPKPVIIKGEIEGDIKQYIQLALKHSRAVDNEVYSRKYRREMLKHYIEESFNELKSKYHA